MVPGTQNRMSSRKAPDPLGAVRDVDAQRHAFRRRDLVGTAALALEEQRDAIARIDGWGRNLCNFGESQRREPGTHRAFHRRRFAGARDEFRVLGCRRAPE